MVTNSGKITVIMVLSMALIISIILLTKQMLLMVGYKVIK